MKKPVAQSYQSEGDGEFLSVSPGRSLSYKLKILPKIFVSTLFLVLWSLLMLAVAVVTLFSTRRLYNEYLARWLARGVLYLWGIKLVAHGRETVPGEQVVYISNHSSTIDIFAIIALGLARCRYFLTGRLRRIVPLGIIATVMGTFFTHPQSQPDKRTQLFKKADRTLRRTGESVYLSPEGTRVTTGEIGMFNKGAFHLATSLKVPIVPFYIYIPKQIDPGRGLDAAPGTIHVYFDEPIQTDGWELQDLTENKERVRNRFLDLHQKYGCP
jgi:1-acyl-sn-glycerol-3-phosphate acyltransferase